jgi:hypothetical protein
MNGAHFVIQASCLFSVQSKNRLEAYVTAPEAL